MTAVTTLLPTPFLRMLFKPDNKGTVSGGPRSEESAEVQVSGQLG
jgi:hypothetical protein